MTGESASSTSKMRCPEDAARVKVFTIHPVIRTGICRIPMYSMNAARSPADSRPAMTSLPPNHKIAPSAAVKMNAISEPWDANIRVAEYVSCATVADLFSNLASSCSAAPNALTTRIPAMFSCNTEVIFPVSARTCIQVGRSLLDIRTARQMTTGTKAMLTIASRQFVASISAATNAIMTKIESPRTRPKLVNIRTASTSAVPFDIRLPVCCWSWKPKLRLCSFLKKSSRRSYAALWETASAR